MKLSRSPGEILKAVVENIPNVVAILVASRTVYDLGVDTTLSPEHLNSVFVAISTVLILICANQLWLAIVRAGERGSVELLGSRFDGVEASIDGISRKSDHVIGALKNIGNLVVCPRSNPTGYVELFSGFTKTFCACNPAYSIEKSTTLSNAELLLIDEVYIPRYKSAGGCTAKYLFFTGDKDGQENLLKFKRLMIKVANSGCGNVVSCLHVKKITTKHAGAHDEMYFGTQHGHPTVVHELSAPGEVHGQPSFYYVSHSDDFLKICEKNFDIEWEKAKYVHNPEEPTDFFTPEAV